jgi:Ca2+-binding RTX toxin-like protein
MFGSIRKLFTNTARPTTRQARLDLETMEDRMVLSTTVVSGQINITASAMGTTASVTPTVQRVTPFSPAVFGYRVVENGSARFISDPFRTIRSVDFFGTAGNDTFTNNTSLTSYVYGRAGIDRLTGGSGTDWLFGESGNDVLTGRGGADWLYGFDGLDTLYGGEGNDYLNGGQDAYNDLLYGGMGADRFQYGVAGGNLDYPQDFDYWGQQDRIIR